MSITHIAKALKIRVGNTTTKFVLVKLADNANSAGTCFPSYQHIADQCEISRRSVVRHIKRLVELDLVVVKHRKTEKGSSSNFFQLKLDSQRSDTVSLGGGDTVSLVTDDHHPSDTVSLGGDTVSLGGVTLCHWGGDTVSLGGGDTVSPITVTSLNVIEPKDLARKKSNKLIEKSRLENSELPDQINALAWGQWLDYREKIKKPFKTVRGELCAISEIIKISKGDKNIQQMIINQSIDFEWVGLFEINDRSCNKHFVNKIGASDADYSRPEGF